MFRVILPVDVDDDRAVQAAETVSNFPCAETEVEVLLLNVFKEFEVSDGEGGHVSSADLYDEDTHPETVEAVKEYLEERNISVTTRRTHGKPAEEIVTVATEEDADGIVMTGHRRTPVGKVVFGSVTQAVLLNAEVPVTITLEN